MNPSLLIRLRPTTPWRIGPDSGSRDQAGSLVHSDALYSAVCQAMDQLGVLEEWLEATARPWGEPAARFSSCFPFQRGVLFAPPPEGLWPPPPPPAAQPVRLRWKGASFVPLTVIGSLLRGEPIEEGEWAVDGHSGCLIPAAARQGAGPFRFFRRSFAAVDRPTNGRVEPYAATCLQFTPGSGLWAVVEFSNQQTYAVWAPRIQAAFRLLADNGIGGFRSRGFGRFRLPEIQPGTVPELLLPGYEPPPQGRAWWLLSLFTPGPSDSVRWESGRYSLVTRSGRSGAGHLKKAARLVREGSVLVAETPLAGSIRDVAPAGSPHPVYRAGFAVALPIALRGPA